MVLIRNIVAITLWLSSVRDSLSSGNDNSWWGYSSEHGWVVLDRSIPQNKPGEKGDLLFLRCSDATTFKVEFGCWKEPLFTYAPSYLQGRNNDAAQIFDGLKKQWPEVQAELHRQIAEQERLRAIAEFAEKKRQVLLRHQQFVERRGISYKGVSAINRGKVRRVTHCYLCKAPLDNAYDAECVACSWIVCNCGACGCGWERRVA